MTRGHHEHESESLRDLMQALLDGELSEAQREQFEAHILEDNAARRQYLDVMEVHALVRWSQQWSDAVERVEDSGFRVQERKSAIRNPQSVIGLAVAAAIALAVTAWFAFLPEPRTPGTLNPRNPEPSAITTIAMITQMHNVRWAEGFEPPQAGQPLLERRLELKTGRVQMLFESGAVVDLIGPAVFQMSEGNRARLEHGEMLAWVPQRARGFTVDTPAGRVIDLGTEFALRVDADGSSLLHVLSGHVQVEHGVRTQSLIAGQAVRFDATSMTEPVIGEVKLFANLLRPAPMLGYVHYSFDRHASDSDGSRLLNDDGVGMLGGPYNARIAWSKSGGEGPGVIEGPFGEALDFDGADDSVDTDFAGLGEDAARTVALWVRLPAGADSAHAYGMLSYGRHAPGRTWQMSWNPLAGDGKVGAARVGLHSSQIVGSTDLRDGQWHHIAATFDGSRFKLYVDADLEADVDFSDKMHTDVGPTSHPMTFGRNLSPGGGFFRGAIDEVYFFDAALNADEVRHLMQTNHVPGQPGE